MDPICPKRQYANFRNSPRPVQQLLHQGSLIRSENYAFTFRSSVTAEEEPHRKTPILINRQFGNSAQIGCDHREKNHHDHVKKPKKRASERTLYAGRAYVAHVAFWQRPSVTLCHHPSHQSVQTSIPLHAGVWPNLEF